MKIYYIGEAEGTLENITITTKTESAVLRSFQWTTELPTEPGWYWVVLKESKGIACVLVTKKSKTDKTLCVGVPGFADSFELDYFETWLGPLPEPESPK